MYFTYFIEVWANNNWEKCILISCYINKQIHCMIKILGGIINIFKLEKNYSAQTKQIIDNQGKEISIGF